MDAESTTTKAATTMVESATEANPGADVGVDVEAALSPLHPHTRQFSASRNPTSLSHA